MAYYKAIEKAVKNGRPIPDDAIDLPKHYDDKAESYSSNGIGWKTPINADYEHCLDRINYLQEIHFIFRTKRGYFGMNKINKFINKVDKLKEDICDRILDLIDVILFCLIPLEVIVYIAIILWALYTYVPMLYRFIIGGI